MFTISKFSNISQGRTIMAGEISIFEGVSMSTVEKTSNLFCGISTVPRDRSLQVRGLQEVPAAVH